MIRLILKLIKYRTYRNKLKEITRKAKEKYYRDKCQEYRQNTSKLWKMVNRITQKERDKTNTIEYLKINNIDYYDSKLIAEEFAKHFSGVGETYATRIPKPKNTINHYLRLIKENDTTMYMTPTSKEEIGKYIDKLENKTSRGNDDISNKLLKQLRSSLIKPLEILFNLSMSEGVFPHLMKSADVVPLYKSKERHNVTNYRPISLLITVSKLLEKVMYNRTYEFLKLTGQFYQGQNGFRTMHSCETAIAELVGTILKNQEEKKYTLGVFIDLSKAFDTLNHQILLTKLNNYGIRGHSLQWFTSYLSNRTMRVKHSTDTGKLVYSTEYKLDYGTPQGSCLGPLLFLVFINDIHLSMLYSDTILFADDTTIFQGGRDLKKLKHDMEIDLLNVMDWLQANQLTLNMDKTICVLFSYDNQPRNLVLNLREHNLNCSEFVKFLGLWIDHLLNWRKHLNALQLKIKQNTNLLRLGNKFLTKAVKKQVFYAHIYSHLKYGLLLWGNMIDQSNKDKLQKQLQTCFKLITSKNPTRVNFHRERMLMLDELIKIENQRFGFKLQNGLLPIKLEHLMWTDSKNKSLMKLHHYNTRQRKLPRRPKAQNRKYYCSFQFRSMFDFGNLPSKLRNSYNLKSFTRSVKWQVLNTD